MHKALVGFTCFETLSTDGDNLQLLCDGTRHARYYEDSLRVRTDDDEEEPVFSACDGSCRPDRRQEDLRAMLEKAGKETKFVDGSVPSRIEFDDTAAALFASDRPLSGTRFDSYYCKRDSRGISVCLGDVHVKTITSFDWLAGHDTGFFQTHRVTCEPCDGSCAHPEVA